MERGESESRAAGVTAAVWRGLREQIRRPDTVRDRGNKVKQQEEEGVASEGEGGEEVMAVGTETGFGDRDGDEVEDEDKGEEEEVGIDIDMGSCAGCS